MPTFNIYQYLNNSVSVRTRSDISEETNPTGFRWIMGTRDHHYRLITRCTANSLVELREHAMWSAVLGDVVADDDGNAWVFNRIDGKDTFVKIKSSKDLRIESWDLDQYIDTDQADRLTNNQIYAVLADYLGLRSNAAAYDFDWRWWLQDISGWLQASIYDFRKNEITHLFNQAGIDIFITWNDDENRSIASIEAVFSKDIYESIHQDIIDELVELNRKANEPDVVDLLLIARSYKSNGMHKLADAYEKKAQALSK